MSQEWPVKALECPQHGFRVRCEVLQRILSLDTGMTKMGIAGLLTDKIHNIWSPREHLIRRNDPLVSYLGSAQ